MQTSVSFKNLEPSDHLKAYVSEKLNRFDKLLDNPAEAGVVLAGGKTPPHRRGQHHRGPAQHQRQGRNRGHVLGHRHGPGQARKADQAQQAEDPRAPRERQGPDADHPRGAGPRGGMRSREVKIESIEYKPMDVEEAVLQMDLGEQSFLVFTNARSSRDQCALPPQGRPLRADSTPELTASRCNPLRPERDRIDMKILDALDGVRHRGFASRAPRQEVLEELAAPVAHLARVERHEVVRGAAGAGAARQHRHRRRHRHPARQAETPGPADHRLRPEPQGGRFRVPGRRAHPHFLPAHDPGELDRSAPEAAGPHFAHPQERTVQGSTAPGEDARRRSHAIIKEEDEDF